MLDVLIKQKYKRLQLGSVLVRWKFLDYIQWQGCAHTWHPEEEEGKGAAAR